jgi:hypothetical protein
LKGVRPLTNSSRNEDRMLRGRAMYLAVYETRDVSWETNECKELWCEKADRYLELLNIRPAGVGGLGNGQDQTI